jgi:hypothetical protein
MAFNKFVVGSWNGEVWCKTRKEGIVGNVFVLVCCFNG